MVTFVVNFYRDHHLAVRLARQLRRVYRGRPVVFIGDGAQDRGDQLTRYGAVYEGERLKHKLTGEWTARYLGIALQLGNPATIVKLDADTCLWREFKLPEGEWAGTLNNRGDFIRGGAVVFSRRVARLLVESGELLNPDHAVGYYRYRDFLWPDEEPSDELISLQDAIVGNAMRVLGVLPSPWDDVYVLGNENREPGPEERGDVAASHPHR